MYIALSGPTEWITALYKNYLKLFTYLFRFSKYCAMKFKKFLDLYRGYLETHPVIGHIN